MSLPLRNSQTQYGWPAVALHWLMAAIVFGLFGMGLWMTGLNYYDAWYHRAPYLHQGIGMLFLALLAIRMPWAWLNTKPAINGAKWERMGAVIAHRLHYILMLAIGLSGYLVPTAEGGGFEVPPGLHVPALFLLTPAQADFNGAVHHYAAWAIMVLAALHTMAALKHHFVDKDNILLRMLGIKSDHRPAATTP